MPRYAIDVTIDDNKPAKKASFQIKDVATGVTIHVDIDGLDKVDEAFHSAMNQVSAILQSFAP